VSTRDAAAKSVEMLEKVGARVVGSVVWGLEGGSASTGYYAGYYGDYYYADYYKQPESGRVAGKQKGRKHDSGAKATVKVQAAEQFPPPAVVYVPEVSPMRRFLGFVGRVMAGLLGFLAVLVLAALVTYFLDQYFGWGIVELLASLR